MKHTEGTCSLHMDIPGRCTYLAHVTGRPQPSKEQVGGSQWILVCPAERNMGCSWEGLSVGFKSVSTSYLTGHRCLPEHFAEVQEGVKRLLACCRSCDNLRKMPSLVSVNLEVNTSPGLSFIIPPPHVSPLQASSWGQGWRSEGRQICPTWWWCWRCRWWAVRTCCLQILCV